MKHLILILGSNLFLILSAKITLAQTQQVNIKTIEPPEGLTWNFISDIAQDAGGNMWFSTHQGLYRYDGIKFTTYMNDPAKPGSLPNNNIEDMCLDKNGNVWVGSLGYGVSKLDPATGLFTRYMHIAGDDNSLGDNSVYALLADTDGYIWMGTSKGAERFDEKSGQFRHFYPKAGDTTSLTTGEVRSLYQDKQGTLWIGTGTSFAKRSTIGGLNRYNKSSGTFTRYMHKDNDETTLIENRVNAMLEDSKGNFWVGTGGDGLHIMDRKTGQFKRYTYDPANPEKLSRTPLKSFTGWDDHILFINEDASGVIWIGTCNGMKRYDPRTGKATYYSPEKNNLLIELENIFWCSYTSRDGVLWIGDVTNSLFTVDVLHSAMPYYAFDVAVNSAYQESPDVFWVGTEGMGLVRHDHKKNTRETFMHDDRKKTSISDNYIFIMRKDTGQKLWVGTAGGLNLFDLRTHQFSVYKKDPLNKNSLNSDSICFLYEDQQKNFWVGTQNGGLNLMDRTKGSFTHYPHNESDSSSLSLNYVSCIAEDSLNRLLVGNWDGGGLNLMDRQQGKFTHYLKGISINYIYKDRRGVSWIGTPEALYRFNVAANKMVPFSTPLTGKKISAVLNIVEDDKQELWICSKDEFIRIDSSRNKVTFYGKTYGVRNNTFAYGDGITGLERNIIFCYPLGYYSFKPDEITNNPNSPQLVITEFLLQDQVVKAGKGSVLETSLMDAKEIRLNYKQNFFSFEFNAIDYSSSGNDFFFMLENYDKDWRKANASDLSASYFNVLPGQYVFHVKVTNSDGLSAERSVRMIISPPWWRTWWAYTLFGIAFITALAAFIYYRSKQLRRDNKLLEEKVTHRTAQLNQSLEHLKATQTQLIQSEKMASLGELTAGIAHEIQNPLNFVNNFSEVNTELIDEAAQQLEDGNADEVKIILQDIKFNEEKINHHGKRADSIVKGMLQHSRSSSGVKEPTAINALAEEYLRLAYQGFRAKDPRDAAHKSFNVSMQTDFDTTVDKLNIIPQDIGRVLLNLYNNAFYAVNEKSSFSAAADTVDKYEPIVAVSTKKTNDKVEIKIKDNGNGIPQNIIDKIFQPFFTTKPTGQGTGLGLSLSYDIVKAHGGAIKVQSDAAVGTEFIIQLPIS